MFELYGKRVYGKTDIVPGLLHVSTQFMHVCGVPLLPMASYVMVDTGTLYRVTEIPLSFKSVWQTWARVLTASEGLFLFCAAVTLSTSDSQMAVVASLLTIMSWTAFAMTYQVTIPGPRRALELARYAGIELDARSDFEETGSFEAQTERPKDELFNLPIAEPSIPVGV